jgi:hypothetical protein
VKFEADKSAADSGLATLDMLNCRIPTFVAAGLSGSKRQDCGRLRAIGIRPVTSIGMTVIVSPCRGSLRLELINGQHGHTWPPSRQVSVRSNAFQLARHGDQLGRRYLVTRGQRPAISSAVHRPLQKRDPAWRTITAWVEEQHGEAAFPRLAARLFHLL